MEKGCACTPELGVRRQSLGILIERLREGEENERRWQAMRPVRGEEDMVA